MRRWGWLVLAVLTGGGRAPAQMEETQTVQDFRVPQYDEQGRKTSEIAGGFAKIRPDGIAEITDLQLDFFKDTQRVVRVTAPECVYDQKQKRASSRSRLKMEGDQILIEGVGFSWMGQGQTMEIYSQVKVTLYNASERMKGMLP